MMCEHGDTVEVRVHHVGEIRHGVVDVDRCIAPVVEALNEGGIATEGCCCGHGKTTGHIVLTDGRILAIFPNRGVYLPNCPVHLENTKSEAEDHIEGHRWIPVTERMPKSPTQYLCCDMKPDSSDLPSVYVATTWSKAEGFYADCGSGECDIRVYPTHWKPIILPEEPAKEILRKAVT